LSRLNFSLAMAGLLKNVMASRGNRKAKFGRVFRKNIWGWQGDITRRMACQSSFAKGYGGTSLVELGSPSRSCGAAKDGAGEGDRTLVLSLENSCSTIELHPQL
jgi:hypothetical protein